MLTLASLMWCVSAVFQPASDLDARLDALDERIKEIETCSATFDQSRATPMLKKPITSSGVVLVKGDVVRWNTREPAPSVLLAKPGELRIHDPEAKVLEIYRTTSSRVDALTGSPMPRMETLRKHFEITGVPDLEEKESDLGLRLIPKTEDLAERVEEVLVVIDTGTPFVRRLTIRNVDGDETVIRFEKIRIDVQIDDDEMVLEVPAGTRITKYGDESDDGG